MTAGGSAPGAAPRPAAASASAASGASAAITVSGLRKSFDDVEVLAGVELAVRPGAVVALLGPSGCGKTTLLRTIAGLEVAAAGEVRLADRLVAGPGVHVPPEKRRVGMVFQDWALFPHLTVAQNVGYGLPRPERKGPRVAEVLAMVGLDGLGSRQPGTLSGGQQQRVALARALAPRPGVLLLDEPFSNLDTALRTQVRTEVHQLLAELAITTVFVTHDQEEAFVLGDEVAVMHQGRVVQQATPAELYARPADAWVARFVGDANLIAAEIAEVAEIAEAEIAEAAAADGDAGADGAPVAVTALGRVPLAPPARGGSLPSNPVEILLRPEDLRIDPLPGPSAGAVAATVELREYYGHDTVYVVHPDGGPALRVRAGSAPRFARGDRVGLTYTGPPTIAFPTP